MKLTPAIKGKLTKARKTYGADRRALTRQVRSIFMTLMPFQQAKHATRKFMASLTGQ